MGKKFELSSDSSNSSDNGKKMHPSDRKDSKNIQQLVGYNSSKSGQKQEVILRGNLKKSVSQQNKNESVSSGTTSQEEGINDLNSQKKAG